jgi:integrating conjugative element protein (TIGR03755 family)
MSYQPKKLLIVSAIWMAITGSSAHAIDFDIQKEATKAAKNALGDDVKLERNSKLYYKIGGARPLSTPPSHSADLKVGGKAKFGAGYSCGQFDPSASLQNFFNDIQNGVDDAMNTMSQAASSAIAGLPALALSRNSPDLYELLQTNVFRAEEKLKFNAASCEEIERQIAAGENPYKQWTEMAQATTLDEESESNPDVNDAMKKVGKNAGDDGVNIPVPGKGILKAGGKNQDPIRITTTATVTGYNTMLQRTPTSMETPSSADQLSTSLVQTFSTPAALANWTTSVIGEKDIYTTKEPKSAPEFVAGRGLTFKAAELKPSIEAELNSIIQEDDIEVRSSKLASLSKTTTPITSDLIKRIDRSEPEIKPILIEALAEEVAMGSEIHKALTARRALIVSLSEPNIASSAAAKSSILEAVELLEDEIERSMFEYRLRKELVSDLASSLYENSFLPSAEELNVKEQHTPSFQIR